MYAFWLPMMVISTKSGALSSMNIGCEVASSVVGMRLLVRVPLEKRHAYAARGTRKTRSQQHGTNDSEGSVRLFARRFCSPSNAPLAVSLTKRVPKNCSSCLIVP